MKGSPATVQTARIAAAIEKLASFTETDRPYTRLVFSPEFDAAEIGLPMLLLGQGLFVISTQVVI